MKILWIEEYEQCGCSSEAHRKKDLLGYCALHGGSRRNIYKIPVGLFESELSAKTLRNGGKRK
jgi:hypothetical protein